MSLLVRPIIRQLEMVSLLEKLLRQSEHDEYLAYQLFELSTNPFQKELAVVNWQLRAKHVADLHAAAHRFGGDFSSQEWTQTVHPAVTEVSDALFQDCVRRCLDANGESLHQYEEVLRRELPIDVRMMLERHRMECQDRQRRMEEYFLPLPHSA
jgi:hypothetical protein